MANQRWGQVWQRKGLAESAPGASAMEVALALDGYDSATAAGTTVETFIDLARAWAVSVGLTKGDSVYEVGSGAGAFLNAVATVCPGISTAGCDFSESLIEHSRDLFPAIAAECAEALALPVAPRFDHVTSFGVFLYFPNRDYAAAVLARMAQKANRTVSVLDVPDLALQPQSESFRRAQHTEREYRQRYADLPHQYYSGNWFISQFDPALWTVTVQRHGQVDYPNAPYRFNVVATRREAPLTDS